MVLYTVREAARVLRVNNNKVYELINTGKIIPLKLGSYKIPDYEIERFVKTNQGKEL